MLSRGITLTLTIKNLTNQILKTLSLINNDIHSQTKMDIPNPKRILAVSSPDSGLLDLLTGEAIHPIIPSHILTSSQASQTRPQPSQATRLQEPHIFSPSTRLTTQPLFPSGWMRSRNLKHGPKNFSLRKQERF